MEPRITTCAQLILKYDEFAVYFTNNEDGEHQCAACSYSSNNKTNMLYHVLAKHMSLAPFGCTHCSARTKSYNNIVQHLLRVHGVSREQARSSFLCSACHQMHYSPLNLLSHYLKEHSSFRENDRTEEEVAELERQPRARSTKRQQQQEASGSQQRNNEAPENLQTQEGQRSDQDIRGARRDPSQTQRDEFDEQLPKRTSQMDRRERLESIPRTIHQREDRQMPTDPFPRRMRDVRDGDQERQQREESDAQFRDDHRMQREQLQDWQPSIRLQQYQEPRRLESMEGQALSRSFGEGITGFVRPRGGGDDTTQEHRSVRQRMSVQWLTGDTQPKPNDDEVDER